MMIVLQQAQRYAPLCLTLQWKILATGSSSLESNQYQTPTFDFSNYQTIGSTVISDLQNASVTILFLESRIETTQTAKLT